MRILIDYRPALRRRSGVGEYVHQLACALTSQLGPTDRLTLFSSSWRDRLHRDLSAAHPPTPSGVGPHGRGGPRTPNPMQVSARFVDRRIPVRLLHLLWHRLGWPPVELLTGESYDVVHSPTPLRIPSRAASVVTVHDLDFLHHPERTRAEMRRDYRALARDHATRADHVIVPSEHTAARVASELKVPPSRVSVIPHGAPGWVPRASRPETGYLLFVGTLEPRKNVGALLDAYELLLTSNSRVPDLVLAGSATDAASDWLRRIALPPLLGRARHLGYVDPHRREQLYAGASVLVLPSFDEGFGLPVLEAMSIGVPVVASARGALPDLVGDAGLLVDPEDSAALAGVINRLLTDQRVAEQCITRGLAKSSAYSWQAAAQATLRAYLAAITAARARMGVLDNRS